MAPSDPHRPHPTPSPEAAAAIRAATELIRTPRPEEPREERFGTIFREADPGGFRTM